VEKLLRDEEWGIESDRWIGDRCGVDGKTVARVRAEVATAELPQLRKGRDGKTRKLPTRKEPTVTSADVDRARSALAELPPKKWECPTCRTWWPADRRRARDLIGKRRSFRRTMPFPPAEPRAQGGR